MDEHMPTAVKIQLLVAVVALAVTIGVAITLPELIETKGNLESEIYDLTSTVSGLKSTVGSLANEVAALEERKLEAEASFNAVFGKLAAQESPHASSRPIVPRADATAVPGIFSQGRQNYDYRLWVDVDDGMADNIDKVTYRFDHSTFRNKQQESSQRSNGFSVSYRGWGCLYLVTIEVAMTSGQDRTIEFDMCRAIQESQQPSAATAK